jgi:hypothetical protein
VEGKGEVRVLVLDRTNKHVTIHLRDVLFVPECEVMLVSTDTLLRSAAGVPTGALLCDGPAGPVFTTTSGNQIPLTLHNGLTLLPITRPGSAAQALSISTTRSNHFLELHKVMAHFNFDDVRATAKDPNIPLIHEDDPFCEACKLGKATPVHVPD